jgi:2-polyprenyl-3-methyl-5-hydroxy-6-metoxy-1,4-benzoquinol methylase
MQDDATRWDERYRSASPPDPLAPEPLDSRADLLQLLPDSGVAIDIACGLGRQSLWLAQRGLEVVALDVSPMAIDALRRAAASAGLAERIDARAVDLDDGLPSDPRTADVVVCQRFRQPSIYPHIAERLRTGGLAIITVLSEVGTESPGPFHAPRGELAAAFTDFDVLYAHEDDGVSTIVARRR